MWLVCASVAHVAVVWASSSNWVGVSAGGLLAEPPPTAALLQGAWPSAGGAPEVGDGTLARDTVCDAGRAAARSLAAARSVCVSNDTSDVGEDIDIIVPSP